MNNQERFTEAGNNERKMFADWHLLRNDFEILKYSDADSQVKWDVYYSSSSTLNLCEIKTRTCTVNQYETGIIKFKKFRNLLNRVSTPKGKVMKVKPIYAMIYNDGTVALWDLKDVYRQWKAGNITRTTLKYKEINVDPDSKEVENDILFLPFNLATIYN